jgi:hypothetical protein
MQLSEEERIFYEENVNEDKIISDDKNYIQNEKDNMKNIDKCTQNDKLRNNIEINSKIGKDCLT